MATGFQQAPASSPRRPLKTRQRAWAQAMARWLTRTGVSPNFISLASVVFACAAGACLWFTAQAEGWTRVWLFLGAAAGIQLRLLCNLLDGMVAIEGGRKTVYGEILNDMPDRFADVAILVAAGYSLPVHSWGRELGWLAGVLAVMTAYVRLLGGSMGVQQYFLGPMAKPQRMAVMTAACLISTVAPIPYRHGSIVGLALVVIVVGSAATLVRRTLRIARDLKSR
jgi:phosphatidylglycerophosphate synthase